MTEVPQEFYTDICIWLRFNINVKIKINRVDWLVEMEHKERQRRQEERGGTITHREDPTPRPCSNHLNIFTTSKLDTVQDAHPQSAFHSWFNLLKALGRPDVPD